MSFIQRACVWGYAQLVRLFPRRFQEKFGEELRSDFVDSLEEARQVSAWEFVMVCLRELRDLPMNLLRTHFEKKRIRAFFHSPSLRFSSRGALAFGLSFASVNLLYVLLQDFFMRFAIDHVKCFLITPDCQAIASQLANILAWAVSSMIGGVLFAVLFTGKNQFWQFSGLAILAYLVPGIAYMVLPVLYGISSWFTWGTEIVTGIILGIMMARLAKARGRKISLIAAGSVLYPLLVEIFYRAVWAWFPPASSTIFLPAEVKRNVFLEFLFAGIPFGLLMGLLLGWRGQVNKKAKDSI